MVRFESDLKKGGLSDRRGCPAVHVNPLVLVGMGCDEHNDHKKVVLQALVFECALDGVMTGRVMNGWLW